MDKSELKRVAAAHGLTKLTDQQLEPFGTVLETGRKRSVLLPKDLHWSEEPAHVLRLTKRAEGGK